MISLHDFMYKGVNTMANAVTKKLALKINFDNGLVDGKQKLKSKTISQVGKSATDEGLLEVANVIGGLQTKDIYEILKIETKELTE